HPGPRLPDRAEPGDADRGGGGDGEPRRRSAVHVARPAHQVRAGVMAINAIEVAAPERRLHERTWRSALWLFVRQNPLGALRRVLMVLLIVSALFADVLSTHNPVRTSGRVLVPPGSEFWLGTDNLGRDLWSRVVHGSRISLLVGIASPVGGGGAGGRRRLVVRSLG